MKLLLIKFLSRWPFWMLYLLSDFLFVVVYRIVKYRKKVVLENLRRSFPEKKEKEIKNIAHQFYLNLTDILVETLKGYAISKEELKKRVELEGAEHLSKALSEGKPVMALTSHLCNWEWILLSVAALTGEPCVGIYKKLKSEFGEELMKQIRGRFSTELLERKQAARQMIAWRKSPKLYGMVADQSPHAQDRVPYFWKVFLNQETVFYRGPAVLAPKLQMEVVYLSMERVRRGYYKIRIQPMRTPPFQSRDEDLSILKEYVELLEKDLQKQPANWLWSHKRWKQKRGEGVVLHQ